MLAKSLKIRRRRPNLFSSILIVSLLLFVICFLIVTDIRIWQRRVKLTSQIESLKKEIEILEEKKKELQAKISQGGTEEYLEKVAREQFGLKAPGEEVVVIQKEKTERPESEEKKSWWDWLKSILNR